MTYDQVLDYLFSQLPMYQKQGKAAFKKDLTNIIALSEILGNPHQQFKSVHLAGTNGKGSCAHSIASVLQEAGYKVGLYTSPHLKDYRERIRINGEMISEEAVISFVETIRDAIRDISPSFFEITVAMAFDYFAREKVDIAIIETGLGGRLDSTNILMPELSVITSIGMDHMQMLGDTVEKIAGEKAGIIKPGVPVVLPKGLQASVKSVFEQKALLEESPLNTNADSYSIEKNTNGSLAVSQNGQISFPNLIPGIKGNFYLKNLPTIIESINELKKRGFSISDAHLIDGIRQVVTNTGLKGRWQKLIENPLVITDVGHNEDGWNEILNQFEELKFRQLHIVLGMVSDKEVDEIFDLLPSDAIYYLCEPNIVRAMPVERLVEGAIRSGFTYTVCKDVNDCIEKARSFAIADDFIFVGGSTFVVAEINDL
ncbi:MAG: folylpolyglutamate synthase/dihydrofolate synthase family protein [Bacteroidota bacterium]